MRGSFTEVTREEFFNKIDSLDITPYPIGYYPYTSLWKLRNGFVLGKSVKGKGLNKTKYYLASLPERKLT